jgi:hypothetical protein
MRIKIHQKSQIRHFLKGGGNKEVEGQPEERKKGYPESK